MIFPIWYHVDLEGRYEDKVEGIDIVDVSDLREAIKNRCPEDITCALTALRFEITPHGSNKSFELNRDTLKEYNSIRNLIEKCGISDENPIEVCLPGK